MPDNLSHSTLVGTGGWAYFNVPLKDRLRAYSKTFGFVEVNSSYYEYPDLRAASSWRSRVPEEFEFSLRCHRSITQALKMEDNRLLDGILNRMGQIGDVVRANVLAILLPKSFSLDETEFARKLHHIATVLDANRLKVAIEFRCEVSSRILDVVREEGLIQTTDISREEPSGGSETLYSRIFGKGQSNVYQFDDEEITDLAKKSSSTKFEKSILAFHGVRMYGDAARLKAFLQTGKFLQVTGQTGLDSLGVILKEDSNFPVSRSDLIARQGWKLFDLTLDKRMRATKVLSRLPDKTYSSHSELLRALEPFLSSIE